MAISVDGLLVNNLELSNNYQESNSNDIYNNKVLLILY